MKKRSFRFLLCLAFLIASLFMVRPVRATLGGTADSVESDRKTLSAVSGAASAKNGYTVREIDYDGNAVREYISSSGVVFAVAWNGLRHPDLATLLGSYADQYNTALQNTVRQPGSRHLAVRSAGVVVEKWGHVRNLQGRAYAPDLIPQGVSIDEIK
jgi:hypothetical protein